MLEAAIITLSPPKLDLGRFSNSKNWRLYKIAHRKMGSENVFNLQVRATAPHQNCIRDWVL